MQQENKNDSVQLSTRYQQYVFAKGHLRGTRRPEVFPIGESSKKLTRKADKQGCADTLTGRSAGGQNRRGNYIKQLNKPKHSNDRVYSDKGLSPTLNTAQGGNRQPFITDPQGRKNKVCKPKPFASTLRANTHGNKQVVNGIRRLTPMECERLQGFPDGWTANGTDGVISDTQRYKTLGNAVTVNVIKEIMLRVWIKKNAIL